MLQQLASREPSLLTALGMARQDVAREVDKLERAKVLAAVSPEAKAHTDRCKWSTWLVRYQQRLHREQQAGACDAARVSAMNGVNPKVVLRNWVAQVAIEHAEDGDFSVARKVLALLQEPFKEWSKAELEVGRPAKAHGGAGTSGTSSACPSDDPGPEAPACSAPGTSGAGASWQVDQPPPPKYAKLCVSCSS